MNRLQRHPLLAALFALALLAGGVGAVHAQQADPPDATACPMMGEGGTMDMEGMDMQAMMDNCPMMQSGGESGGMMGMMSKMKDCPMTRGMMRGPMHPDSTMHGEMGHRSDGASASAVAPVEDGV